MNSGKVKEIKKALECCGMYKYDCEKCPYKSKGNDDDLTVNNGCGDLLLKDCLTLINELESENEALQKGVKRLKKRYEETITKNADECVKKFCETTVYHEQKKLVKENQQLKDENERLNKALVGNLEAYEDGFNEGAGLKKGIDDRLKTENTKLKDRIAELEKERAELKCSLTKKTMEYELLKCGKAIGNGILEVATKTKEKLELLEFAERLKKKCEYNRKEYCCEATVSANDIDETLKEFIKGE